MPLIIIVGKPCTGKTTVANALAEFLRGAIGSETSHGADDSVQARQVELINEEALSISKDVGYSSSYSEKNTRGCLKSATEHRLRSDCFLIVDSLNYIKGYRYELYCAARTARIPHCVLWVAAADKCSQQWNQQRLEEGRDAYKFEIMQELRMRFEAPNESNRWDSPLFKIVTHSNSIREGDISGGKDESKNSQHDEGAEAPSVATTNSTPALQQTESSKAVGGAASSGSSTFKSSWRPSRKTKQIDSSVGMAPESVFRSSIEKGTASSAIKSTTALSFSGTIADRAVDSLDASDQDMQSVFKEIWDYFHGASVPVPNSSTIAVQRGAADILHELDRISQQVVQSLVVHQQSDSSSIVEGTPLKFPEFDRALTLHRPVGLAELQRFRRQYVKINSQHPPPNTKAVGASFIDFLAAQL